MSGGFSNTNMPLTASQISEMMANAKRSIDQRKKELEQQEQQRRMNCPNVAAAASANANVAVAMAAAANAARFIAAAAPPMLQTQPKPVSSTVGVQRAAPAAIGTAAASMTMMSDVEKARRLAELQAKIKAGWSNAGISSSSVSGADSGLPSVNNVANAASSASNYVVDSKRGLTIDTTTGKEVQHVVQHNPTLKANQRARATQQQHASSRSASNSTSSSSSGAASSSAAGRNASATTSGNTASKLSKSAGSSRHPSHWQQQSHFEAPKFVDTRLLLKSANRTRRAQFNFVEPGSLVEAAKKLKLKARLSALMESVQQKSRETGISKETKLAATIQPKLAVAMNTSSVVPEIEWWDACLFQAHAAPSSSNASLSYSSVSRVLKEGKPPHSLIDPQFFTDLIEHPIQMRAPADIAADNVASSGSAGAASSSASGGGNLDGGDSKFSSSNKEIPLLLTKKENKKLRRQNRAATQQELQEKVRLGLAKPPEPKIRMSNLMRVLGTEAVRDPTKIEAYVRAQMEKRQQTHEKENLRRKLTPEQRRAKLDRKIAEDVSGVGGGGINVAVYKLAPYTMQNSNNSGGGGGAGEAAGGGGGGSGVCGAAIKYKVLTNASQLKMTGILLLHSECNVLVVEGGPRQQRKYKRLLTHRIKWGTPPIASSSLDAAAAGGEETAKNVDGIVASSRRKIEPCSLVWEGIEKQRAFGQMQSKICPTELYARDFCRKHSVEHYWDLAFSQAVLEDS